MSDFPRGFIPVLTRLPLDALLAPFLPRLSRAVLVSVTELPHVPLPPGLPLMADSGGYLAFQPDAQVVEEDGLGALHLDRPHGEALHLSAPGVWAAQLASGAAVHFTLDFPSGAGLSSAEQRERQRLSLRNAAWAAAQPRGGALLYACHQPGLPLQALLDLNVDGIALGGLARHAGKVSHLQAAVHEARKVMPRGMPLHVLGIGNVAGVRACLEAGATSVDASTPQRQAASGQSLAGQRLNDPSQAERMHLALDSLHVLKTLSQAVQA